MKNILLVFTLCFAIGGLLFAPSVRAQDFGIYDLSAKTNLDSTDILMLSQASDSTYYKLLWDRIVDSVEDSIRGQIINSWIKSGAAIALNKLASGTAAYFVVNNVSGVPTYVAMSGDATLSNAGAVTIASNAIGSTEITDGSIVNADVNASAGIVYSKLTLTNSIVSADITDGTVTGTDIADESVTTLDIDDGTIANADISSSAAIALSKLASGTAAYIIVNNSGGVPTYVALSGDATISNAGVLDLTDALSDNFTFSGNVAFSGSVSATSDSVDISSGLSPYEISASGLSETVILYCANTSPTIADFSNGTDGQRITLISAFSNQDQITIDHGAEIFSQTGADVVLSAGGDSVTLVYYASYDKWVIVAKEI